ncbi:MAG TPA: hypothetical protein VHN79_13055 [Lacunisphaera sp.]|nr:hypothetical protein [Lacunisphaera sp.]
MKLRLLPGLVLIFASGFVALPAQNTETQERAVAARMLAYGRLDAPETSGAEQASVSDRVAAHRGRIVGDADARRTVAARAFRDAAGRAPSEKELASWAAGDAVTYAELLSALNTWLARNPDEHRAAIDRAYQLVTQRPAYAEEYEYWKPVGVLPYVLLVGAIENWAFRNQPGLMVTTGTPSISVHSRYLSTARLSPAVANEARVLLDLPVWTDVARLSNPGHNVVAVAANDIASVGGVHFVLAGGGPLAGD